MRQVLVISARLSAGSLRPVAVAVPVAAQDSFSLGFVLGDPRALDDHRAVQARLRFSPALAAAARPGAPAPRGLRGRLRDRLGTLRFYVDLAVGARYRG